MYKSSNKELVSVIICTYNRCESLRETLESLQNQVTNNHFEYELVIVNNNSKDRTSEVVKEVKKQCNREVRYIFESKQGLSYARNKGVEEARGQIIVFPDDDVIADENWLLAIYNTFNEFSADCVGGKILPIWMGRKPTWISDGTNSTLGILDYGDRIINIISEKYELFGANFAIKKNILEEMGLFRTDLGMVGNKLMCGEETDLFMKLIASGKKIIYQPNAFIFHKIPPNKLRKSYFMKRYFYAGKSYRIKLGLVRRTIFNIPIWIFRDIVETFWKCILYFIENNETKMLKKQFMLLFWLGAIAGSFNLVSQDRKNYSKK